MNAPTAAVVIKIGGKNKNIDKTQNLASNYGTNQAPVVCENFIPQNGTSTQLIHGTICVEMWDSMIGADEHVDISSYQTLSADKTLRI